MSSINGTCFMMICCKIVVDTTNDQRLDIAYLCMIHIYYDIYIYISRYIYIYCPENQRIPSKIDGWFQQLLSLFRVDIHRLNFREFCSMYGIFTYIYPLKLPKCR